MNALSVTGKSLYDDLLPAGLKRHLADMAQAEQSGAAKIALLINGPLQWMPWELMYDGEEFLSLRFQIARLPVEPSLDSNGKHRGYATYEVKAEGEERTVKRIVSVLGKEALDTAQEQQWARIFKRAGVAAARIKLLAPTASSPGAAPKWSQVHDLVKGADSPPDILHITCHGDRPTEQDGVTAWTLDSTGLPFMYDLDDRSVGLLCATPGFQAGRPLVFGNACSSSHGAGAEVRSLASEFLKGGASAFVGTIAPISNQIAVEFADEFYKRLLKERLPIGEALHATKQHFSRQDGVDPSWLFYCLYGSPMLRFRVAA
jgi:CHAT domain-containing protein